MTERSETQDQAEQPETTVQSLSGGTTVQSLSGGKTILALAVFALGLNASAAVYTLSPSDFALPDVSRLAELLPHQKAPDPVPDPVLVALKDIQSAQQQSVAALKENNSSLQQSAALRQQNSYTLASLRQSLKDEKVDVKKISGQITDQHLDVKKMSAQISKLIAKIELASKCAGPRNDVLHP